MQSLSAFFEDNKPLAFVIMFAALLVLIIVLFLLYRFIFGRRLKAASGGRARQPRLGIVDAFDLDRQRQLVLVRRDNVEHLIMIGGPNDLVVESSIVRTQSVASMSPARDKDSVATGSAAPQIPAVTPLSVSPSPALASISPSNLAPAIVPPPSSAASAPPRSAAPVSVASPSPVVPPPAPLPIADRPPTRPAPSEETQRSAAFATAPQPAPTGSPTGQPAAAATSPLPPRTPTSPPPPPRPALAPRPSTTSPLPPRAPLPPRPPRPVTPPPVRPDPSQVSSTGIRGEAPTLGGVTSVAAALGGAQDNAPAVAAETANRASPSAPANLSGVQPTRAVEPSGSAFRPEPAPPKGFESLESLEEEMAKLLGRTTPRREG